MYVFILYVLQNLESEVKYLRQHTNKALIMLEQLTNDVSSIKEIMQEKAEETCIDQYKVGMYGYYKYV